MSGDRKRKRPDDGRGGKSDHRTESHNARTTSCPQPGATHDPRHHVDAPATNDVLFGRGAPIIRWQGNVKFRELIRGRKEEYLATRRHAHKDTIAREIIEEIEHRGGRFLKKVEASAAEDDFLTGLPRQWMLAEEGLIIEKVKQALRDREPGEDAKKSAKKSSGKEITSEEEAIAPELRHALVQQASPPPSGGFASADTSQSQPMAPPVEIAPLLRPRPIDPQSQLIAELQQRLLLQQSDYAGTLFGGSHSLPRGHTGSNFGHLAQLPDHHHQQQQQQLPDFSVPTGSASMSQSNEALLQLEVMRQQRLQFQRLLAQSRVPMHVPAPAPTDPMSAAIGWFQARQDMDTQQRTIARLLQEGIQLQATTAAVPVHPPAPPPQSMRNEQKSPSSEPRIAERRTQQAQHGQCSPSGDEEDHNSNDASSHTSSSSK